VIVPLNRAKESGVSLDDLVGAGEQGFRHCLIATEIGLKLAISTKATL
jgi:hypothetical protein